jgi:hypothetical protein
MGFYNVQIGDMPYFTELAKNYAISDNYHQAKPRRIRPTVAGGWKLSSSAKCSTIGQRMSGAGNGSA